MPFKYTFMSVSLFAQKYKLRKQNNQDSNSSCLFSGTLPGQERPRNMQDALWLTRCLWWGRSSYVISSRSLQLTPHPLQTGAGERQWHTPSLYPRLIAESPLKGLLLSFRNTAFVLQWNSGRRKWFSIP